MRFSFGRGRQSCGIHGYFPIARQHDSTDAFPRPRSRLVSFPRAKGVDREVTVRLLTRHLPSGS